jgi:hypothetical protein
MLIALITGEEEVLRRCPKTRTPIGGRVAGRSAPT